MNTYINQLVNYLHTLSLRERALVLAVACAVVYLFVDTFVLNTYRQHAKELSQQQQTIQNQQQTLTFEIEKSASELAKVEKANAQTKQDIADAKQLLEETKSQLKAKLSKLVPPTQVTELLRSLLANTDSLKIISLNNEPVRIVTLEVGQNTPHTKAQTVLYEHATIIKLSGQYQQLYNYLKALENSGWELFWDTLHYKVIAYPNAEITLRVRTISTDEHWIGL